MRRSCSPTRRGKGGRATLQGRLGEADIDVWGDSLRVASARLISTCRATLSGSPLRRMTMRRTLINMCMLGALAALPLSGMILAAAPASSDAVVDAAMNGNRDAVRALLKDRADVNTAQADGMTALHWAAQK